LIVHCAFGQPGSYDSDDEYIKDQEEITKNLLNLRHKKFLFISSIDVLNKQKNTYSIAKRNCEKLVTKNSSSYLILRPALLVGDGMRESQIIQLVRRNDKDLKLTLSGDSTFSIVWYSDIAKLIESDLTGIYSMARYPYLKLSYVANFFNKKPRWGKYSYQTFDNPENNLLINSNETLDEILNYLKEIK